MADEYVETTFARARDSCEAVAADAGGEIAERIRRLREAEDGHAD